MAIVLNGISDGFYNLTNGSDNVSLNSLPTAGFPVRGLDGSDTIDGSFGNDNINGNTGNDEISGEDGNDYLRGGKDSDTLLGGTGDDTLNGNFGNDDVFGGSGNDIVRGGQGNDLLFGGDGNDTLIGDFGVDNLTGGSGEDVFVLRTEDAVLSPEFADVIADFTPSVDFIGFTGNTNLSNTFTDSINFTLDGVTSPSTAIRLSSDGSYLGIVFGVTPDRLLAGDFINADSVLSVG